VDGDEHSTAWPDVLLQALTKDEVGLPTVSCVDQRRGSMKGLHRASAPRRRPGQESPADRLLGREEMVNTVPPEPPVVGSLDLRVLEAQIAELRQQLAALRSDFETFRGQFE
jgi:hypothetical protein